MKKNERKEREKRGENEKNFLVSHSHHTKSEPSVSRKKCNIRCNKPLKDRGILIVEDIKCKTMSAFCFQ